MTKHKQRFKARRNNTLLQEIAMERVERACRLLKETDLTVEAVSDECGFPSLQRFSVQFKRCRGMSPGRWRKQ